MLVSGLERYGGVAQLGEHLLCTQEVIGSSPFTSTMEMISCGIMRDSLHGTVL